MPFVKAEKDQKRVNFMGFFLGVLEVLWIGFLF
jgi:hypothetical protein